MELIDTTFIVVKESMKELLDDVDEFKVHMDKFNDKHDNPYEYNIEIYKQDTKSYVAELNINKKE